MNTYIAERVEIEGYGIVTAVTKAESGDEAWKKIVKYLREQYGEPIMSSCSSLGVVDQMDDTEVRVIVEVNLEENFFQQDIRMEEN
jgi:hypothetical protein